MKEGKEGTVKEKGAVVGHLEAEMRPRRKMKMWVLAGTKGMRVSTASMIKTLEIREEDEASMVPVSVTIKK